jgi:GT2 family glycosyltransferase
MSTFGLSIIIPTKERDHILRKTLIALENCDKPDEYEIIIINDSSSSIPVLDYLKHISVKLYNNEKSGVASARNFGVRHAKYDTLLFMDDDIIVQKDSLLTVTSLSVKYAQAAINVNWTYPENLTQEIKESTFGRYLLHNGYTSLKGWSRGLNWRDTQIFEVDLIASYFLIISKQSFFKAGGYNESFPHAGAEDYEFARRIKQNDIKCYCDPTHVVWHNEEDRIELLPWLNRKERSAETRKIAVSIGYIEMSINARFLRKRFLLLIYRLRNIFLLSLSLLNDKKNMDKLYFKITNLLLASYLTKGYFKK